MVIQGDVTMGLIGRRKSGKIKSGSRLIVPGQGVQTVKKPDENKKIQNNVYSRRYLSYTLL